MILMTAMTTDLQTWFMHTAQAMLMLLSLLDFTADFHPRLNDVCLWIVFQLDVAPDPYQSVIWILSVRIYQFVWQPLKAWIDNCRLRNFQSFSKYIKLFQCATCLINKRIHHLLPVLCFILYFIQIHFSLIIDRSRHPNWKSLKTNQDIILYTHKM